MRGNPYDRFESSDLLLRDELALDRTILANERTLLAYIRTGLAFAVTGAAIIKFLASLPSLVLGWCLMILAVVVTAVGAWRFRRVAGHISTCRRPPAGHAAASPPQPDRGTAEPSSGGDQEGRLNHDGRRRKEDGHGRGA
jgi:putative membrane protein